MLTFSTPTPQPPPAAAPTQHVLFMCPHGAGKSVLALRLFRAAGPGEGRTHGRRQARGTEPDPQVSPKVAEHLTKNGHQRARVTTPQARDARRSRVGRPTSISLGCTERTSCGPARCGSGDEVPGPAISPGQTRILLASAPRGSRMRFMYIVQRQSTYFGVERRREQADGGARAGDRAEDAERLAALGGIGERGRRRESAAGASRAPKAPWSARAPMNTSKLPAAPASADAPAKPSRPTTKVGLRPKMSPSFRRATADCRMRGRRR